MTTLRKKTEGKLELWNSRSEFSTRKDTLIYQKNPGNLLDQYANLMKTSKTCSKAITKEMLEQKDAENAKDQERSQRPSREHQPKRNKDKDRTSRRNQILVKNSMIYMNSQTPST